jgi:hypothetical protein
MWVLWTSESKLGPGIRLSLKIHSSTKTKGNSIPSYKKSKLLPVSLRNNYLDEIFLEEQTYNNVG